VESSSFAEEDPTLLVVVVLSVTTALKIPKAVPTAPNKTAARARATMPHKEGSNVESSAG